MTDSQKKVDIQGWERVLQYGFPLAIQIWLPHTQELEERFHKLVGVMTMLAVWGQPDHFLVIFHHSLSGSQFKWVLDQLSEYEDLRGKAKLINLWTQVDTTTDPTMH